MNRSVIRSSRPAARVGVAAFMPSGYWPPHPLSPVSLGIRRQEATILRTGQNRTVPASPNLKPDHACLIVHGSDRPGIVAAVSAMITRIGGNIVAFDQYSDDPTG
ncbi:MAG: formyltetrahydrofolate hydrolase, partial [Microbacterium sp.]|nr:formyltetrahydrofolate hydrolase [Microbacterium sp.]